MSLAGGTGFVLTTAGACGAYIAFSASSGPTIGAVIGGDGDGDRLGAFGFSPSAGGGSGRGSASSYGARVLNVSGKFTGVYVERRLMAVRMIAQRATNNVSKNHDAA